MADIEAVNLMMTDDDLRPVYGIFIPAWRWACSVAFSGMTGDFATDD
jgi:hypothetical protein